MLTRLSSSKNKNDQKRILGVLQALYQHYFKTDFHLRDKKEVLNELNTSVMGKRDFVAKGITIEIGEQGVKQIIIPLNSNEDIGKLLPGQQDCGDEVIDASYFAQFNQGTAPLPKLTFDDFFSGRARLEMEVTDEDRSFIVYSNGKRLGELIPTYFFPFYDFQGTLLGSKSFPPTNYSSIRSISGKEIVEKRLEATGLAGTDTDEDHYNYQKDNCHKTAEGDSLGYFTLIPFAKFRAMIDPVVLRNIFTPQDIEYYEDNNPNKPAMFISVFFNNAHQPIAFVGNQSWSVSNNSGNYIAEVSLEHIYMPNREGIVPHRQPYSPLEFYQILNQGFIE